MKINNKLNFIILMTLLLISSFMYLFLKNNKQKIKEQVYCNEKIYFSKLVIDNHKKFINFKDTLPKIEHHLINTCYYLTKSNFIGLRIKLFINSNDLEINENYFFEELFTLQNELENYCKIEEISCLVYNEQVKDKYNNNNFYLSIECDLNKNTYKILKTGFDLEKYFYFIHGNQLEILY